MFFVSIFFKCGEGGKIFFVVICDGEYVKVKIFKVRYVIWCLILFNEVLLRCRIFFL